VPPMSAALRRGPPPPPPPRPPPTINISAQELVSDSTSTVLQQVWNACVDDARM
jgi:hypothetical protein